MQESDTSAYHAHCLLIHAAQKSNRNAVIVLSACLCTVPPPPSPLWRLPPSAPPSLCEVEGRCCGWARGSRAVSHTLPIGSYRPHGDNKNTSSSLHLSHLSRLYWQPQPLFHYNDIILIGASTAGRHLLILGLVIRQCWVMLLRAAKGKEPSAWPGGLLAWVLSGSLFQIVAACWCRSTT